MSSMRLLRRLAVVAALLPIALAIQAIPANAQGVGTAYCISGPGTVIPDIADCSDANQSVGPGVVDDDWYTCCRWNQDRAYCCGYAGETSILTYPTCVTKTLTAGGRDIYVFGRDANVWNDAFYPSVGWVPWAQQLGTPPFQIITLSCTFDTSGNETVYATDYNGNSWSRYWNTQGQLSCCWVEYNPPR
jgi:hypothetical protein